MNIYHYIIMWQTRTRYNKYYIMLYMRIGILLECGKHLNDRIISLKEGRFGSKKLPYPATFHWSARTNPGQWATMYLCVRAAAMYLCVRAAAMYLCVRAATMYLCVRAAAMYLCVKAVAMYLCVRAIRFASIYNYFIVFWNSSDSVVCLCFSFFFSTLRVPFISCQCVTYVNIACCCSPPTLQNYVIWFVTCLWCRISSLITFNHKN